MSRARHKASGGGIGQHDSMKPATEDYPKTADVEKDAVEEGRSKGGRAPRKHKAKGGSCVDGMPMKRRMDRPGRKYGGRTGSDRAPLSSANKTSPPVGHSVESSEQGD